ncbi:hypothetical protein SO802_006034 [Lithocarpus litseifolius]|uniref:DUF7746 domain-containing protein n=1 Tax=Lithocarpus litseifolius TaxID=425828 RepID=A0AAW2DQC1_9ROSI
MDKLWRSNSSINSRTIGCPSDIVNEEDHTIEGNEILDFQKWNIPKEIINKMGHMSMVGIAYLNNHNLDHIEIVELLVTGFSGTLHGWRASYLTEDSRESIKSTVKKNDEGLPIFDESIGRGIPDGVNTLIYTILKHFVSTPSNVSSRISDYLNNLRCPTMFDYKWYQDVFLSRVMLRKDCYKPYRKEKFIDGLPPIFAYKIKYELNNAHICHDNVCFRNSSVFVKNMIDKVILGLPIINALYPFLVEHDGITSDPFGQKVKFKFASEFEIDIDNALNLIHAKTNHLNFLKQEVRYKKIAEQLSDKFLQ